MRLRYWVLLVLVFTGAALFVLFRNPVAKPSLPSPNGLDYYLKAAKSLNDVNAYVSINEPGDALRRYVATNQEALRQIRLGLGLRCVIPPKSSENGILDDLASFRTLSQLLRAEGDQALSEGRNRDAAKAYLDGIHLGQEISRGMLLYDLVGISIEQSACKLLTQCKEKLSLGDRQFVVDQLSILRTNREPFAAISEREKIYFRLNQTSIVQTVMWPVLWYKMRPALQKAENKGLQNIARIELLCADFASQNLHDPNHR